MADADGSSASAVIASAVIIPETDVEVSSKRRQSSLELEPVAKKARVSSESPSKQQPTERSPDPAESTPQPASNPTETRSTESILAARREERKRGQRLFGGLINTLSQSQTTSSSQQKRRLEIEKRQQERAKQQKIEDDKRKAAKREELKAIRQKEQIKFNEQSMRIRHSNLLAVANFLCTKAEPKLYYKPWQMLPEEEERIKIQIAEAEALIERETAELGNRPPKEKQVNVVSEANNTSEDQETVCEPATKSPSVPTLDSIDTTNVPEQSSKPEKPVLEEHNGEVVVENEEDTVIY